MLPLIMDGNFHFNIQLYLCIVEIMQSDCISYDVISFFTSRKVKSWSQRATKSCFQAP